MANLAKLNSYKIKNSEDEANNSNSSSKISSRKHDKIKKNPFT
jgi:hypothetical protein